MLTCNIFENFFGKGRRSTNVRTVNKVKCRKFGVGFGENDEKGERGKEKGGVKREDWALRYVERRPDAPERRLFGHACVAGREPKAHTGVRMGGGCALGRGGARVWGEAPGARGARTRPPCGARRASGSEAAAGASPADKVRPPSHREGAGA